MSLAASNQPTTSTLRRSNGSTLLPVALRKPSRIRAAKGTGDGRESTASKQLPKAPNHHRQTQPPKSWISNSTPVGVWDRFPTARTVQQMMDTMERMMQDPFAYSGISFPSLSGSDDEERGISSYRRWRTPWEIKEGDGEYKMRFDMPGMTKEDVKVWVEEKILVVKAEKQPKKKKSDNGVTDMAEGEEQEEDWSAKSYGRYNSRIVLPDNVNVEKITAEVKDGVLYITIPKAATPAKMVDIDVK